MSIDPTRKLKNRFGAAINWRVRDAIEPALQRSNAILEQARQADRADDRELLTSSLAEMGSSLAHISATLTEQQRALGDLLEELDRRVSKLERR